MADLFFADRVRETSVTTGVDDLVLDGPLAGHRRFADAVPQATNFHYAIAGITHESEWEVGIGALTSAGRLSRSPLASSQGGGAVDLSEGVKAVALTVAADWFAAQQMGGTIGIADVDGLSAALDGKQPAGDYASAAHVHAGAVTADGSGNVGIGVASPAARLHIADEQPNDATLQLGNDGDNVGRLRFLRSGKKMVLEAGGATGQSFFADFQGHFYPGADDVGRLGLSSNRWDVVFASTASIITSDERAKTAIGAIPGDWLDAWDAVQWQRFRFVTGVRWHAGLVAQQVHQAFADRGIDAFAIGLCCRDEWSEERDPDGAVTRPAGDRWGLRYDECFALEVAWQRRKLAGLEARLAALEAA